MTKTKHMHVDRIAGSDRELAGIRERQAVYTPAALVPAMTSLTSTAAYQTSTAATTGVLRTIHAQANAAAHNFTVSTGGADAAATRLFDAYALTANVPAVFNGWWVVPATVVSWLGYKCDTSTGSIVMLTIGGYTYA
jgi:hypothetical protein